MNRRYVLLVITILPLFVTEAFAQEEINITEATPCFMNYTAKGIELWQNCGFETDYMGAVTVPFEWVTGGMFSMFIVIVLIGMTWFKYKTPLYPIAIGIVMMPMSFFLFPDEFTSFAFLLMGVGVGAIIWFIVVQKTRA